MIYIYHKHLDQVTVNISILQAKHFLQKYEK